MVGTLEKLPAQAERKEGTTSSHHGPYAQGYTRATMAYTKCCEPAMASQSQKVRLSSDWALQLEPMKLESLVIAHQHGAVNTFPGLVHTARHTMGVGFTRRRCANRKEAAGHGKVSDWGEVVTR